MLKRYLDLVSAPGIFLQMILISVVTAVVSYFYTFEFGTATLYGLGCLLLLQVGYFGGVAYLAWRESAKRRD